MQKGLIDPCESCLTASREFLLPSFAYWADDIGKLQLGVIALFVRKVGQIVLVNERESIPKGE